MIDHMIRRNSHDDDADALMRLLSPGSQGAEPTSHGYGVPGNDFEEPGRSTPSPSPSPVSAPWNAPAASTQRNTSANAPRLTQSNGGWTLNEHGNQRNLQANEVGDAQRYVSDFWQQFPTGFQPDNPNSLNDAYRQFTGRDGDPAGLAAHRQNPGGLAGAINTIASSPEAATFGNQPQGSGATPPPSSVQPSVFQGFTPRHAMEGFAFDREQNTGKSAKDAFAFLANQAPPPPIHDKNALAQWFRQYIEPGMNQLGHNVISVDGDKFRFRNWQGEFDVDYGRGAGAQGGALAWQVDPESAVMGTEAYQPRSSTAPAPTTPTAPAPVTPIDRPDQTALDRIREEVEALMSGGPSPMDADALRQLLGV